MMREYPIRKLREEQLNAIIIFNNYLLDGVYTYIENRCPGCRSVDYIVLYKNDRYGISSRSVLCKKCGLIYQNPILDVKSITHFYNSGLYRNIYGGKNSFSREEIAKKYNYDAEYELSHKKYSASASIYHFIKNSGIDYKTICELGAGGGWNLIRFIEDGKSVVGYEPDKNLVDIGKSYGVELIQGFIEDVQGKYDLIILKHVLEHLPDPISSLEKIRNHVLKYLYIEVPGIVDRIPSIQNAHISYFSLNTLQKILASSGYEVIKIMYFENNNFISLIAKLNEEWKFKYNVKKEIRTIKKLYYSSQIKNYIVNMLRNTPTIFRRLIKND